MFGKFVVADRLDLIASAGISKLFFTVAGNRFILLGTDDNRYADHPTDEDAAKWQSEDEEEILNEFMKRFVRLSSSSQSIIKVAINQAYKEDLANDALQPEDICMTKVTATWRLKERQRMKKES